MSRYNLVNYKSTKKYSRKLPPDHDVGLISQHVVSHCKSFIFNGQQHLQHIIWCRWTKSTCGSEPAQLYEA